MKIPLGILVLTAVALGYLLGTESGRRRREALLVKLGSGGDEIAAAPADAASGDTSA